MIGQTILHYKILEKLGEGGMGEVFKAQDTKLDRFVALKFLPSQLIASEDDKARFIQEAKAASAMNHPNVCTIYDIQENDGQLFIVMEFVEGKTLKDKRDSISEKQILEIGIQAAEGLAAAHEKGIVHRDIKPENIMIRKDGIAQIMDFGLAKLYSGSEVSRLTKAGTTMGTMGYMSPEQVQGLDVDHRTDIFSLGVVLYELLAGESPFKGMHETAIMYEIVNIDAPPLSTIKKDIDPQLDDIILECLEKDKDERCQSAKELAKDLRKVKRSTGHRKSRVYNVNESAKLGTTSGAITKNEISSGSFINNIFNSRNFYISISSLLLIIAIISGWLYLTNASNSNATEVRSSVLLPRGVKLTNTFHGSDMAISPDGKFITFVGTDSTGTTKLWLRPVNSLRAKPLAVVNIFCFPFWSPDSRYIAYFTNNKLLKIPFNGGEPVTICEISSPGFAGGSWSKNGTIVFLPSYLDGIYKVSADGGKPESLIKIDTSKNWGGLRWPYFLPDGKHFLFTTISNVYGSLSHNKAGYSVYIASVDNPRARLFLNLPTNVQYSNGYIFFVRQGALYARRFDPDNLEFSGQSIPLITNIQYYAGDACGVFSVSDNGKIIYQQSIEQNQTIVSLDRKGNIQKKLFTANIRYNASLSPNSKMIAFDSYNNSESNQDIWIYNISRDITSRFTFNSAAEMAPVWSPDSKQLIFSSSRSGKSNSLYIKDINGTGKVRPFLSENKFRHKNTIATDWSGDGKYIAFQSQNFENKNSRHDIFIKPLTGGKKPFIFLATDFNEGGARFSPNGKWLAYWSNQSGNYQIYISSFSGRNKWQVTNIQNLSWSPWWKDQGKEICYETSDEKIFGVKVRENETGLSFSKPFVIMDFGKYGRNVNVLTIDKSGDRFIAGIPNGKSKVSSITMISNWVQEINK